MSNNSTLEDVNEALITLYTLACAPILTKTAAIPLSYASENVTIYNALKEFRNLHDLSSMGNKFFIEALSNINQEDLENLNMSSIAATELVAGAAFAKRISFLANQVSNICTTAAERIISDPSTLLRKLEQQIQDNERPKYDDISNFYDLSPEGVTNWTTLDGPLKNRVGFKNTTAVIFEGKIKEEALKGIPDDRESQQNNLASPSDIRRRKQRNPTGYHKFNFKTLTLDDSDIDSETRRSTRGTSTDGESTRGSFSGTHTHGILTSRSASSEAEDHDINEFDLERRNSIVGFSCNKEREIIQDDESDPKWEEEQRHQKRFSRIRNRVPTGHPSLMRGASDELAEIVDQFTKKLSSVALDPTAVDNTNANRNIPPYK